MLKIARLVVPTTALIGVAALALAPASALAYNPNNEGHHYGQIKHQTPPVSPGPVPTPISSQVRAGPAGATISVGGATVHSTGAGSGSVATAPVTVQRPAATALPADVKNVWFVALLLATIAATNVVLAVMWISRGGQYLVRRVLSPVPVTA